MSTLSPNVADSVAFFDGFVLDVVLEGEGGGSVSVETGGGGGTLGFTKLDATKSSNVMRHPGSPPPSLHAPSNWVCVSFRIWSIRARA